MVTTAPAKLLFRRPHSIGFNIEVEMRKRIKAAARPIHLWHVTDPRNIESITRHGLKPHKRMIFVLTTNRAARTIAVEQCFLERFSLFRIDAAGISGRIERDDVAELTAGAQRIIRTSKPIKPR